VSMAITMPKGCISCLLCQGAISVRSGNLEKFRVHMESDHDVFFGHDILIAINFLEAHEKEIIIEKVLPRMKLLFTNIRSFDGKFVTGTSKIGLEKRLLEIDDGNGGNPTKKLKPSKENDYELFTELNSSIEISDVSVSGVNEEINIGDESDDENIDNKISDDEDGEIENDAVSVGDTLTESINSIKDILKGSNKVNTDDEFANCDVCNQSVRKSILDFHRKSHLSGPKSMVAECDICRKVMQKKSLNKHRRRCEIMNNLSKNNFVSDQVLEEENIDGHSEQSASTLDDRSNHLKPEENDVRKSSNQCPVCFKPMLKGNIRRHIRMVHGDAEVEFKCKICFTGFQQLDGLKVHTNTEHHVDLEDVEQMLQENSNDQSKRIQNDVRMVNESYQGSVNLDPEILEKVMKSVEHDNTVGENSEDVDAKKFKCEHCDNVYTNKDSVRRHRRKAHTSL